MKLLLTCTLVLLAAAQPARAAQLSELPFPVPVGAYPDDPADSLYSAARAALAERRYERAADLFHEITTEDPNSSYAANAAYYEAFARSRLGDVDNLRQAYRILRGSAKELSADARALEERVCGQLVRKGDSSCKQRLQADADRGNQRLAKPTTDTPKCPTGDEGDIRIAALDALMQVDADRAMPILKQVLARRDACSVELRRKAVFLVSQKAGSNGADILLETARSDPDQDVREQAVFWLSQVQDGRAVGMLDSLLLHSDNDGIREKALFALSQQKERGSPMLREFASNENQPGDLREKAIFWLGQSGQPDDEAWLRQQFRREKSQDLKEKIIFSIAQHHDADTGDWLLGVATDTSQSVDTRKKAIFWAGQGGATFDQMVGLYGRVQDTDLKDAMIFAFSQRHERGAIDELISIAKTDKDPEARKKAVFWLGQSHDPRVTQFLQELINK
jgi:HEAT repeat protein